MALNLQLKALIVSFVYGIMISYLIKMQYRYLFSGKFILQIVVDSLFVFDIFLVYFLMLRYINNGAFHIYFLLLIIVGYVLGNKLINRN